MRSPALLVLGTDGETWNPALYTFRNTMVQWTHKFLPALGPVSTPCVLCKGCWLLSHGVIDSSPLSAEQWVVDVLVVCAGALEVAEEGGGRLGFSLIPRETGPWGPISRCLLASPQIVFSGQERCDMIHRERFLLLAIWSLQFC